MTVTGGQSKNAGDDDSLDALIDSVWKRKPGKPEFTSPKGTDGPEEPEEPELPELPSQKRQRGGKPRQQQRPSVRSVPVVVGDSPAKSGKGKLNSVKVLDEAEQICLKCRQLLSSFEDSKLVIAVTTKAHAALAAALEKRLTPETASI